jgi:ribokinase
MSVLVFGSLNLDLVTYADKLPAIGETIVGEKLLKFPGGKGLNQAIAARRAGSEVLMVGSIGNDADGDYLFDILKSENIDPKFITKTSEQTGIAVIEVSKSAENRIIIIAGANSKTRFSNKVLTSSPSVTVSLAQLETPIAEVAKFIHESKAAGKITILNPAPIQKLDQQLLQDTDYLIANETEASFLVGSAVEHLSKDEAVTIARQLQKNGSKKVIITLGEQGSVYLDQEKELFTPANKVKAVDTTAAGDAFCGAFATAISENKPVEYALKFASAAGGLAATKAGAVPSLPTQQEILSMITSLD